MSAVANQHGWKKSVSTPGKVMLALALVLGVTAELAILGSTEAVGGPYGQFLVQDATGELVAGSRAGQTFTADQSGLYRIDVYLGTYQRQNRGPLVLHVKAAPFLGPDLARATVDASQMQAAGFVSFEFAPLQEPAGLPLCFWLEAPQARPGNAVTAMGATKDLYPGGTAMYDQLPAAGRVQDLAFRLYYRPGASQAMAALIERLAKGRPSIFGAPQLYQALFAIYLIALAGLLVLVVARLRL